MGKIMEDIRLEERKEIARSLVKLRKLSYQEIAECTKLTLIEVQEIEDKKDYGFYAY